MGVALTALRQSVVLGTTVLRRRMLVSLEIPNRDRAYAWVLAWMASHQGQAALSAMATGKRAGGASRAHCGAPDAEPPAERRDAGAAAHERERERRVRPRCGTGHALVSVSRGVDAGAYAPLLNSEIAEI